MQSALHYGDIYATIRPDTKTYVTIKIENHTFNILQQWTDIPQNDRYCGSITLFGGQISDFEFLNLIVLNLIVPSHFENDIVWLLGVYVEEDWSNGICKKRFLSQDQIKTECAQHYITHQSSNRPPYYWLI